MDDLSKYFKTKSLGKGYSSFTVGTEGEYHFQYKVYTRATLSVKNDV